MNTLNSFSVDMVTRVVTGTLPDLEKYGDDLLLEIIFRNNATNVDPGGAPELYPITSILLTLKSSDTGEIMLQSDAWNYHSASNSYYLHASLTGSALQQALGSGQSLSLLGEIQWVQSNPFYGSQNGNIGPATLRTSSQNFTVTVGASLT